jgi:hypothetical protein
MVIRSAALDSRPRLRTKPERIMVGSPVQLTFLSLTGLTCLGFMMLVLGTMTTARSAAMPSLPDLPPAFLPGSLLPADFPCYVYSSTYGPRCSVNIEGHQVYFDFDARTRIISNVVIPAQDYTVGDLILAWGPPSAIEQTPRTIYISWGTRTAYLYTNMLRPQSHVQFIIYEVEPQEGSPWLGFRWHG